jgi:hypothetical protein
MTRVRWQIEAIVSLTLAAPCAIGQITMPISAPPADTEQSCPQMNQTPSESTARCNVHARSSNMSDGGNHLFLSTTALAGYDTAFDTRAGLGAELEGGQFYVGALLHRNSSYTMIDNTITGIDYHAGQGSKQYLNTTAVSFNKSPSAQTDLSLDVNSSYGNDAIRIVAPLDSGAVEAGSYGIHTGNVLDTQATIRLLHQSTESRWWSVSVRNDFRDFFDDQAKVNTIHGRAEIHYQPSGRAGVGLYEETASEKGEVNCTTQSVGAAYDRRLTSVIVFEVAAGPAFGTKSCVTRVTTNLYAALTAQSWRRTNLYLSAYRKLNDSEFVSATYEDTVQGGLNQEIGLRAWVKVQGGYIRGTVPADVAPFHGEYVAGTIAHMLPRGLSFSLSAQHFNWSGIANIAPQRTLLMGLLSWSSGNRAPADLHGPAAR